MEHVKSTDIRFYGRRSGRPLRKTQKELLASLYPECQILLEDFQPATLFKDATKEIWLEIGFGGGEHLAENAQNNPDVNFIGCEPFINGTAKLLQHIHEKGLKNIRIFGDDCRKLIKLMPENYVHKVFLMFPDPWPKTRHEERRFVNDTNLAELSRILINGGEFRTASDDLSLIDWTIEKMNLHPNFEWANPSPKDWNSRPENWPSTRYEQKALKAGRKPAYFSYMNEK